MAKTVRPRGSATSLAETNFGMAALVLQHTSCSQLELELQHGAANAAAVDTVTVQRAREAGSSRSDETLTADCLRVRALTCAPLHTPATMPTAS